MTNIDDIIDREGVYLKITEIDAKFRIKKIDSSPCRVACPAGVNVKAYLGLIALGKFQQALEVVKKTNPFPGICGRICTYPCESECRRSEIDEPIAIRALKRFIADYELKHAKGKKTKPIKRTKREKIAIVGSGPAGLTAANDLIRSGYGVTVFEALHVAGGMMTVGIPAYRLPKEIIQIGIDTIATLGVEIRTNTKITDVDGLLNSGYDAVFIAIGAHKGLKLNISGEGEYKGLIDCTTFLKRVNFGDRNKPGKRVIVLGGGNSAVDSARTALRLGSDEVHILYRRSRKEMPADELEINDAELEGVKIHYLVAPVKILGKDNKIIGLECIKMRLGEPDDSGRRKPIPIEGSEFVIDADIVIPAISQKPDLSFLPRNHDFEISKWDTFEVDPYTFATNKPGFFAGGDAVTGAKTVIDAMAAGHRAAKSIDRYLSGKDLKEDISEGGFGERELELSFVDTMIERKKCVQLPKLSLQKRRGNFNEVELSLTEEQAIEEAKRCLRCGPCMECVECRPDCDKKLIVLSATGLTEEDFLIRTHWAPEQFPVTDNSWNGFLCWQRMEIPVVVDPVVCIVKEDFCRGCGRCEDVCEYSAIKMVKGESGVFIANVDRSICRGCGTCTAICPSGAMMARHFTDKWISGVMEEKLKQ